MASVVSSVLQRIHPCCNTRAPSPESLQNIIHSHHHRSPSLFLNKGNVYANHTKPALRGRLGVKIGVTAATQNVLFISSALSASLPLEMNSTRFPQRKIGDKAGAPIEIQQKKKKSALTAEKSN